MYNPITKVVQKNLSRFRETAYGGSFRSDGNLICVGGDECQVKLFDASSKSLLRVFKGHARYPRIESSKVWFKHHSCNLVYSDFKI